MEILYRSSYPDYEPEDTEDPVVLTDDPEIGECVAWFIHNNPKVLELGV